MLIDKNRVFIVDEKRIVFLLLFVFMFVLTEIGRFKYRPYIYSNDIFDLWIADTIGNFTGTIAIVFFNFTISNPKYKTGRIFLILITIGLIIYELIQYILPGTNTCDWRDIVATLLAGFISWGIYELVNKKYPEEELTPHNKV